MTTRRIAAIVSILAALATLITAVVAAVVLFPAGLAVLGCAALALVAAWYGVARRGAAHVIGLTVAVLVLVGAILLIVTDGGLPYLVLIIVGIGMLRADAVSPGSIGGFVSFGCIRMHNRDILDLYKRVHVGTRVVVLR